MESQTTDSNPSPAPEIVSSSEETLVESAPELDPSSISDDELDELLKNPQGDSSSSKDASLEASAEPGALAHDVTAATGEESAPPPEPTQLAEENARLKAALEAERQQRVSDKEMLQRRNQEVGTLRKSLREAQERIRADVQRFNDEGNSVAVADAVVQYRKNEERIAELDQHEARLQKVIASQQAFERFVPKERNVTVEAMAEVLRRDGVPEDYVRRFQADPHGVSDSPDALIQLANRAVVEQALMKLVPLTKQLLAEKQSWEQEKLRLKGQSTQALLGVSKAIKDRGVNGSTGGVSTTSKAVPSVPIHQMSDAEIEELLKQA